MGKITKADAHDVANKLVKKIDEEIAKEREVLKEYMTSIYQVTIPKDVMRMFSRGKKWMQSTSTITVTGIGITSNWERASIKELPAESGYNTSLALTDEQATKYVGMRDKINDLTDKRKNTKIEIENLLLALSTWKKALEQLPEIKDYAPDEEKREIMVIPKVTKEKIACLISKTDTKCLETIK